MSLCCGLPLVWGILHLLSFFLSIFVSVLPFYAWTVSESVCCMFFG